MELENPMILIDQIEGSLNVVKVAFVVDKRCWAKVGMSADSGACWTDVGPRGASGYQPIDAKGSTVGWAFLTASWGPIPQLGGKQVVMPTQNGGIKTVNVQCAIAAKLLLPMKRMTESIQFI